MLEIDLMQYDKLQEIGMFLNQRTAMIRISDVGTEISVLEIVQFSL